MAKQVNMSAIYNNAPVSRLSSTPKTRKPGIKANSGGRVPEPARKGMTCVLAASAVAGCKTHGSYSCKGFVHIRTRESVVNEAEQGQRR